MSEHDLSCVVIQQDTRQQQKLLQLMRACHPGVQIGLANGSVALKALLIRSPMLLFYAVPNDRALAGRYERRLLRLLQRLAPDCILVRMAPRAWLGLARVKPIKGAGVQNSEICTIATVNNSLLKQQLDYLLAYARLKAKFRQCKHLLSIAELRSQWLVEYAREAVAYITGEQHLHVNVAYLSLFELNAVSDAQALRVNSLVEPDDQTVFTAVKQTAEQYVKPSNKLLLTLKTIYGKRFRAEIRCIPAVYRGQRCVQLHVHPLLSGEQQAAAARLDHAEKTLASPWEQQSESARELEQSIQQQVQQHTQRPEQQVIPGQYTASAIPTMLDGAAIRQLQPAFKELLNLQGKDYPALLRAQPWLQYGKTTRLDYAQLLANAHDQSARFQLDYWNLQAALDFLAKQHGSPLSQQIVVSLGSWALTNVRQVAQLLKLLKKWPVLNKQLVLGLDSSVCLRRQKAARSLLPLYRASGVNLMFEQVRAGEDSLFSQMELAGSQLVQLHTSHARNMNIKDGVPEELQTLLQQMNEREVATVVSDVQNLNMLNLLSETTATYLQGPILDKFSR